MLKQLVANTSSTAEVEDTASTVANTESVKSNTVVQYENDAARKKNAETMAMQKVAADANSGAYAMESEATISQISAYETKTAVEKACVNSQAEKLMVSAGLVTQNQIETGSTFAISQAKLQECVDTDKLTMAEANLIITRVNATRAAGEETLSTITSAKAKGTAFSKLSGKVSTLTGLSATAASALTGVGIAALAVAGTSAVIVKIIDLATVSHEELRDKAEASTKSADEATKKLDELNASLNDNNARIKELNNQDSLTLIEQSELDKLKTTNEQLEIQLKLQKQLSQEANKKAAKDIHNEITDKNAVIDGNEVDSIDYSFGTIGILNENLVQQKQYEAQKQEYENTIARLAAIDPKKRTQSEDDALVQARVDLENVNQLLEDTNKDINNIESSGTSALEQLKAKRDSLEEYGGYDEDVQRIDELIQAWSNYFNGKEREGVSNTLLSKMGIDIGDENNKDTIKEIQSYINSLSDEDYQILASLTFDDGVTLDEVKKALESAQKQADKQKIEANVAFDDPTDVLKSSDDKTQTATLTDLQEEAELLSTIREELDENGKIGVSSMSSIIEKYPEAKKALSDYLQGMISEEQLFEELQGVYSTDTENYINSLITKSEKDGEFFESLKTNYPDTFNQISDVYQVNVSNWGNMLQAQEDMFSQFASAIKTEYGNLFQAVGSAMSGFTVSGTFDDTALIEQYGEDSDIVRQANAEWEASKKNAMEIANRFNSAASELHNAAYDQISANIDTSWQGMSGYDGSGSDSDSGSDSGNDFSEKVDWATRAVNALQKAFDRLNKTASNTYKNWTTRNSALVDSMSVLQDQIEAQNGAFATYNYQAYISDLDDYYKNLVRNGTMDIETITDENLKNQIDDYQDWYDQAQDCLDAVEDLKQQMSDLAKTKFDNVTSQFEELIGVIEHSSTSIQNNLDLAEAQGYFASQKYYEALISTEQDNLDQLRKEKNSLQSALNEALNSGAIEKYSESWYEMTSSINSVSEAIQEGTSSLTEYENAMRQLSWDTFDYARDRISQLTSESDFLVELLSKKDLNDKDTGNLTEYGQATLGLHASNYDVYMSQAQAYAEEYQKIQAELADDPYNKDLIERKEELLGLQQDAIKSALSEKDAIKDLVSSGYDAQLEALQKLITARKDALSADKDLYDYEKTIADKTATISEKQKQLNALSGDNSEENQAKIQQIKVELQDAKDDLAESEYDKYISDQEKLLDSLYDEYETLFNERLDNFDAEFNDLIGQVNESSSNISNTLQQVSTEQGYVITDAIKSIWDSNNPVTQFGTTINSTITGVGNTINTICGLVQSMKDQADARAAAEEAARQAEEAARQAAEDATNGGGGNGGNDWSGDSGDSGSSGDSGNYGGGDGFFIYSPDYYPKDQLNIDTSIVDKKLVHIKRDKLTGKPLEL